jgi:hypothetical protein
MYPTTQFNIIDNSQIFQNTENNTIDDAPLFMQVFSADKGTEDLIEISGADNFAAMYGTMDFFKHGQSAIQAQNIINAGGRLFAKRVVAEDSLLANLVICANLSNIDDGKVSIKWEARSIQNCKTFDEVKSAAADLLDPSNGVYPLIVFSDNGRGVSKKSIRITPDYPTSKTIGATFYDLKVYEGTTEIEKISISFDPDVKVSNDSYRLDELTSKQVTGLVMEDVYKLYLAALSDGLLIEEAELRKYDIIFGYTNRGAVLEGFELDQEGINLDADNGILLKEGSNGSFGDSPVGTADWENAIAAVFNGTFSDEVYDVDQHKIAAVVDANYPVSDKNAIFDFVSFRQDCAFFRDYGVGLKTYLEIKGMHDNFAERRNFFTGDYATSYQIKDPVSKKNIEVTMLYDMAYDLVDHIANQAFTPLAGTSNGFILRNAIKGTINFTPINTPSFNQKEAMDDIRVNYAIFEDDNCVVQSCYSSQDAYTQLSYFGNIIAIQEVMRAVRTACPRQRYTLASGSDLTNYATAVNSVLNEFVSNFDTLRFTYTNDPLKTSQKIFYASIEFAFLGWAQTEIFDIYAINNE